MIDDVRRNIVYIYMMMRHETRVYIKYSMNLRIISYHFVYASEIASVNWISQRLKKLQSDE